MDTFQLTYKSYGERSILIEWPFEINEKILHDILIFKNTLKNNDIKLNCNIYNDVDPRLKNKPHDYLSMPPFFSDNSLLFLN